MCIEGLNRCFGSPSVDPDRDRKDHDEAGKLPKPSKGGKNRLPNGPPYENGVHSYPNQPKTTSKDVDTRDPIKTGNRASGDGYSERQPNPNDSIGRPAAGGPCEDVEGVSDQPPYKASQVSAFPKNRGANTYACPQETTSKEVPWRSAVKPNNSPIDGSLQGSEPYPEETKFWAKAVDDSEKRMQTKVGNKVIASTGDFKAKEQTKAIDSCRE